MHKSETNMSLESVISDTDSLAKPDSAFQPPVVKDSSASNEAARIGKPQKRYKKRTEFCLTLVSFLVEDTLYSIPEMMFPGAGYLKSAINLASGKSEDEPVELDITISEMDSLMSVLLDRRINSPLDLTIEKWGQALGLATLWKLDAARNFIIDHITRHFPDNLVDQIRLADDNDVGQWLHPAYETICKRDTPPTVQEVIALGPDRLVAILKIRETCRKPTQKDYLRFKCNYCSNIWLFDGSGLLVSNLRGPCHSGHSLIPLAAEPASSSSTTTESVEQLIKTSTELVVTPGSKGRMGKRNQEAEKDGESVVDADECDHDFIWKPTEAKKKKNGGMVACIKICLKCGMSE
ncbi:hypothetical protein FRB94_014316 [Tulasnella sp. JGI-2019a]|nr:hypothetical protein FRB93_011345 [Tulasnella sp. JGI-2019a]KAG8989512.1 hypothetical protein FRB94_014316 [Tulasnella sp. JGI-2019a]KAG9022055.1 hypothetical protein FRB95_000916 [Tulasnella sp. JGI-2019a]